MKRGLPPIVDKNSRILILGSLPGDISLAKQQYYGNPRNHFWSILSAILGEEIPADYPARIAILSAHRIALWDVLQAASRPGSLDTAIRERVPNDLREILRQYPNIRFILLNGGEAGKSFRLFFPDLAIPHAQVRSSSPVPSRAVNTLDEKIRQWSEALAEYFSSEGQENPASTETVD